MSQGPQPAEFVKVLMKHQNDLLRYVLPLVGCLDDAQDVVQETAAAVWRKADQYDPARPFLPWAKRFARNEVLMHHRRRRRYTFLTEELIDRLADRQDELDAGWARQRDALPDCVGALAESDRRLIDDRYGTPGRTIQQIAAETGVNANVLYKSLARIRRQLLECVSRRLELADGM